jgi:hypothetical protein
VADDLTLLPTTKIGLSPSSQTTMANTLVIPQDIIDTIIEAVGDDNHLLKTCAVVSSSFLLPSRKSLFSEIYLRSDQACQRLHQFLLENPVVQSFVRKIIINWPSEAYLRLNGTALIAILRLPFCCLESFTWYNNTERHWNGFSSDLQEALSNIIRSPALRVLGLNRIDMPMMLLQGIHLTELVLNSPSLDDFVGMQSSSPPAAPEEVVTTTQTVIDKCKWYFFKPVHGKRLPTSSYFSVIWNMERSP